MIDLEVAPTVKIISFAWTTEALLAGAKTCTRREWTDSYAKSFECGEYVAAWDKLPRAHGKWVATIELTSDPYKEYVADASLADYVMEGLAWMQERGVMIQGMSPVEFWRRWQRQNSYLWVIRFKLVEVKGMRHE